MSIPVKILVIDDDESIRFGCVQTLKEEGYNVQAVENGQSGLDKIEREQFDVILLDLKMPGFSGMEVLQKIKVKNPNSIVIIITGFATIDSAVEAMKKGAYDFLQKPFNPEVLISSVKKAVDSGQLVSHDVPVPDAYDDKLISDTIIGRSRGMTKVNLLLKKVAPTDSTVLITGETGVGKELVARTIHRLSKRNDKPCITVDCGTLVETLFESELFGHVKGSFTGAIETTSGNFEYANGGTIFLDEIANISVNMQARLLRVIQEREISKVGSQQKIKVDVRILSATNRNLRKEIQEGKFREDLFYRLNVFPLHMPPLRERREDIRLLTDHILSNYSEQKNKTGMRISDNAVQILEMYEWPGNVRELKNVIERAAVTCDGNVIKREDLSYNWSAFQNEGIKSEEVSLANMEKEKISEVLKQFDGNKTKAAQYLGINRKTLREKIRKYGISDNY